MSVGENGAGPTALGRKPDVLTRQTENGSFLFNMMTNELFKVNITGSRIWDLLGQNHTIEEIVETINREFEGANIERIRDSTRIFLGELSKRKLV